MHFLFFQQEVRALGTYCVYCHVNKINGKRYIGLTKESNPEKRWGSNGINYKSSTYFYNAIKKYGWENFNHIILKQNLSNEEAEYWEKEYIRIYNTVAPNGYNLTYGGEIKKQISELTRQKLKESHKNQKITAETKEKMSKSRMGHIGYNRKPVWMCDKKTQKKIKLFESCSAAGEFLNNKHAYSHIGKVCKGERLSAYGYSWQWAEDRGNDLLPS